MIILSLLLSVAALLPSLAAAQSVFAHVIIGNTGAYDINQWKSDIRLASSYGIDGFALNIVSPFSGSTSTQMSYAFQAANALSSELNFKMFFSFDYLGGGFNNPWQPNDIITVMKAYGPNGAYYHVDGRPMVSTFEGPSNSDINSWSSIRSSIPGGIYLVPDWTSLGPGGFDAGLVDGAFSWDMWPNGANDISTNSDVAWQNFMGSKSYMMGVSPWFYTDLPAYGKAWVWRGDDMWSRRWQQVVQRLPEFVEIVTWNDFGESHYIGPIYESGIPSGSNADARPYVNGFPHQAWLETLPYQIAAYKHAYNNANPAPSVPSGGDKVVYWYRTSPASAGSTEATGNNCPSNINTGAYQDCVPVDQVLEDEVFAIVLASQTVSAQISIGGQASTFYNLQPGINFISRPFNGNTGAVRVSLSNGVSGQGDPAITSQPASGVANFNAWVGCAGAC